MHIAIRTSQLVLQPDQRTQIERRASFALSHLSAVVRRVDVSLSDVNGPRGGVDKRCRILVHVEGGSSVFVEDADSDLVQLIDRAMDRAGRAAHKRLEQASAGRREQRAFRHLRTAIDSY